MSDMRVLTLYPEHAEAFRLGLRTIETRSKPTRYRGPLLLHAGVRDPDCPAARRSPRSQAALDAIPHGNGLTKGAVVASCQLIDCVPMESICWTRIAPVGWTCAGNGDPFVDEGQRPFGDFSPGRFAWLLDDVKPTTERCPRCWGSGWLPDDPEADPDEWRAHDGSFSGCPTCHVQPECGGRGVCEPVPMRGKQGLWNPTWDAITVSP